MRTLVDFMENEDNELNENLIIATLTRLITSHKQRKFFPKGEVLELVFNGSRVEVELARDLFQIRDREWLVGGDRYAIESYEVSEHCFAVDAVAAFVQKIGSFGYPFARMEGHPKVTLHYVNVLFDRVDTPAARYLAKNIDALILANRFSPLTLNQTLCLSSDPNRIVCVNLCMLHRLEIRPSVKHPGEKRYAIIEEKLGKGRSSAVFANERTWCLRDGQFHEKQKSRVLHEMDDTLAVIATDKQLKSYDQLLKRLSFLKAKPLYLVQQKNGLPRVLRFEKRMPGETLKEWIEFDSNHASFERRCSIAVACLRALKAQVHDSGVIHCDIKPDNIMVNVTETGVVEVNMIDFNLSCYQDDKVDKEYAYGAPLYLPYESLKMDKNTGEAFESPKRDVYSLGITLGQVFGATLEHIQTREDLIRFAENYQFFGLFNGLSDVSDELKADVQALLLRMVARDPAQRPDLEAVAQAFEGIIQRHQSMARPTLGKAL